MTLISKYEDVIKSAKEKGSIKLISNVKGNKRYKIKIKTEQQYKDKADVIILCIRTPDFLSASSIIKKASQNLKYGGYFYMVHRTERLAEAITLLKKYNLQPKKIRFIIPKEDCESNLFLIQSKKGGKEGIKVLYPLIVHNNNGKYTNEVQTIINGVI